MEKIWWRVEPGCMGAAYLAYKTFGGDCVNPGVWASPIYILCEKEEAEIFTSLLQEHPDAIQKGTKYSFSPAGDRRPRKTWNDIVKEFGG